MEPEKAEFKRLIELLGWSQTDAARRLRKTPSAINHLVNPDHPNKPTQTMMQLLKLIIASERPDLINTQTFELKEATGHYGANTESLGLNFREMELIGKMRKLPSSEQDRIYAIIFAMLESWRNEGGKGKKGISYAP